MRVLYSYVLVGKATRDRRCGRLALDDRKFDDSTRGRGLRFLLVTLRLLD